MGIFSILNASSRWLKFFTDQQVWWAAGGRHIPHITGALNVELHLTVLAVLHVVEFRKTWRITWWCAPDIANWLHWLHSDILSRSRHPYSTWPDLESQWSTSCLPTRQTMDYSCEPEHSTHLVVRGEHPFNAEPSAAALVEFPLTPEELVYCRNHGPVRDFDPEDYTVTFKAFGKESEMTISAIKSLFPTVESVAALQVSSLLPGPTWLSNNRSPVRWDKKSWNGSNKACSRGSLGWRCCCELQMGRSLFETRFTPPQVYPRRYCRSPRLLRVLCNHMSRWWVLWRFYTPSPSTGIRPRCDSCVQGIHQNLPFCIISSWLYDDTDEWGRSFPRSRRPASYSCPWVPRCSLGKMGRYDRYFLHRISELLSTAWL